MTWRETEIVSSYLGSSYRESTVDSNFFIAEKKYTENAFPDFEKDWVVLLEKST